MPGVSASAISQLLHKQRYNYESQRPRITGSGPDRRGVIVTGTSAPVQIAFVFDDPKRIVEERKAVEDILTDAGYPFENVGHNFLIVTGPRVVSPKTVFNHRLKITIDPVAYLAEYGNELDDIEAYAREVLDDLLQKLPRHLHDIVRFDVDGQRVETPEDF